MAERKIKKSFEDWCLENNRKDLLELWDYELNDKLPSEISYCHTKKIYFKCSKGRHESELKSIKHFADGGTQYVHCEQCESFAQFIIDEYGEDYLNIIWSDKNEKSPWDYRKASKQKAWFVCDKDSSHVYKRIIHKQSEGQKCPYCLNRKLDPKKSFGAVYPGVIRLWSDKNDKTPYEYAPCTNQKVWWKCSDGKHDDYYREVSSSVKRNFRCPKCSKKNAGAARIIDLTGQTFGELTVLSIDKKKSDESKGVYWICECTCGNIVSIKASQLNCKGQKTCGDRKIHQRGEGNPNWRGGSAVKDERQRKDIDYINWRNRSMELDDYSCQCCLKRGGNLNVHHIESFAHHPDKRIDLSNSISLCKEHHQDFHNRYGYIDASPSDLEKYINNKRKELGIIIPFNINEYRNNKKLTNWLTNLNSSSIDESWEEPLDFKEE